jgi:hypothetical protein
MSSLVKYSMRKIPHTAALSSLGMLFPRWQHLQWGRVSQQTTQHNCEPNIVLGSGSGLKSDRLADHKGDSFGFPQLLGGECAAFPSVQHLVERLTNQ